MPKRRKVRAIIEDFDGPVVNSFESGIANLEVVAVRHELPFDDRIAKKVVAYWGHSSQAIVEHGLGIQPPRSVIVTKEWEEMSVRKPAPLSDGIRAVNTHARREKKVLTILTGRDYQSTHALLETHHMQPLFDFVHGREHSVFQKPDPRVFERTFGYLSGKHGIGPDECVYVGDTTVDARCGLEAGVETVIVVNGPHSAEEVQRTIPAFKSNNIIPSMRFFLDWLEEYEQ